jgi:hypothetical protein
MDSMCHCDFAGGPARQRRSGGVWAGAAQLHGGHVVHLLLFVFTILFLLVYDNVNLISQDDWQGSADPAEFRQGQLKYTADMWFIHYWTCF